MDYDGNDFQSHNFQLSGEDNSRFSSGLRSFSLPKFELDEHFQVHLRFDSLVEPESLLGIHDQEESSWIEDFSSGNGTLEFTPSAAESCSISRRKNVWSEATSSESVEILLRSVGEDDVIDKRTNIFDLDAHNGLSSVSNHMDPSSIQDVSLQSKEAKAMNVDSILPPDECKKDLPRINKSMTADLPDVQDVSNTFNDEELGSEIFEELDEGYEGGKASTCRVLPEQCNLKDIITLPTVESFATKEKSLENSSNEMTLNDGHLDNEFVEKNASNDHATSPTLVVEGTQEATMPQIDPSASSVNISSNDPEKLSAQNFTEHVTESYHEDVLHVSQKLVTDDGQRMENEVVTRVADHKNEPSKAYRIEQSLDIPESSYSLESKAESSSLLMEGCNEHVASEKSDGLLEDVAHQIKILSKGNGISGEILTTSHETFALVMESERNTDGHSVKICSSDNTMQSMSLKIDSFEQVKEGSCDASLEPKVSLEKDDLHVENVSLEKSTEVAEDCEGRKPGEPVITTEENEDAGSHPPDSSKNVENFGSSVELHSLKSTDYVARGTEEKEDDSLGTHLPELTSHGPESAGIEKSAEEETLENDTGIVGDAFNAPGQVVQEYADPPNSHDEDSENVQISRLQDARSPETCNAVLELEGENSDAHVCLLPKKACTRASTSSDNLNSHMKGEPLDASAQNQNTQILEGHVEGQPAGETTQEVTGNAANCKENSLQSVSLSRSSSEPHLLEGGDGDPSCFKPRCGSPTVISCTQPSSGEVEQHELNRQLSDHTLPVSGDLPQPSSTGQDSEENKSTATDPKESNVSEERSFTFAVGSLVDVSERASVGGWKPFPIVQSYGPPQAEERCSTVSGLKQTKPKALKETPDIDKSTHRDKSRSVSGSLTERSTSSKRKSVKVTPSVKEAAERDGTSCNPPVNTVSAISKDVQLEEKYQYSYSEGGGAKLSCASSVQTSKLPDLNSGAALFHQPFTDLQQVQLRAQIFVYGSLIQGIPPDEACMISAFGNADGARNVWDGIWHVTLERFHSQKSSTANLETPLHSHSGVRVNEQVSRFSPLQGKAHTTPVSRIDSKGASTVISSFMSLPSPLWNVSPLDISHSNMSRGLNLDPNQILPPLHGYQSSHGKQYTGGGNPWLSQASPVPWVASSQSSTLDTRTHFLAPPAAETVQVTPITDSSVLHSSNLQFLTPTSFPTTGAPLTVSATTTVHVETSNKMSSRPEKHATGNQKTRKRRKSMVSEAAAQVPLGSQPCTELDSATAVSRHVTTSIGSPPTISSLVSPTHFQIIGSHGKEQKVIFSEETSSKIEQAKLQAEDAAAFAVAAIRHMEGIWSQLAAQKNSGLGSEIEMKLASAAVAAAAASSVAKAAAAAAKVASDAAMQAKMMADEALSNRTGNWTQGSQTVPPDRGTNMSRVMPFSVFKGKEKAGSSSSVISAAKEAARRRVEAASAASKRAENLDAIVKAAELAAVAVCQAGAVIAMGDPLPFTLGDLIDAGPEGYWKSQHPPAEHPAIADMQREKQIALDCADGHNESLQGLNSTSLDKKYAQQGIGEGDKSSCNELRQPMENQTAPDYDKNHMAANLKEKCIQEGSLVEVRFDEDSPPRRVWYSAKVVSLKDGKAYVCSSDFSSNAGSGKLKEWITLEEEVSKTPRIRIAHPISTIKFEGTRKRRRAALGNYVWAVGDRVDAWIRDRWCEGVVTEKSKEDETKLTVCFSALNAAGGDTSTVSAWHLRPSLIWKDGHWVEWSRSREETLHLLEGDTPQEKRQKLSRLETENDHEVQNIDPGKRSANFQTDHSRKPEESRPLLLSENDKIFSLGKNSREENNPDTLRIKRTGQKEGSRVVFGVPKPGKKRKFMEVSKHYVTGKLNNVSEGSDTTKHAKYVPPQASSGWKNTSRVDPKGRKVGEPKPKVMRPVKPQSAQTKSATEREGSFLSTVSTSNGVGMSQRPLPTAKVSASHEEKSEKIILETVSFTNNLGTEESTVSEASMRSIPGVPTYKKKTIVVIESDIGIKGKVASALEKTKGEEKHSNLADHPGKTIPDANELRRSSRRIQPTSRLLEGLQSSMIISKIPSVSHEKGARPSHRNVPSSKGNIHG